MVLVPALPPSPPINVLFIVNDPSCWHHVITTPLPRAGHMTYMVSRVYTLVIELEHGQQRTGGDYCSVAAHRKSDNPDFLR